jgi:8-oxo-dGTP diphosphatase
MPKPFSVSLKVVISDDDSRCLLIRRSASSRANAGDWEFPGGKIDPGESFDDGLLREVLEETGLVISLERVAGCAESELPERKVAYLILEGRVLGGQLRLSDEHDAFDWVPVAELSRIALAPQFREFAAEYMRKDKRRKEVSTR